MPKVFQIDLDYIYIGNFLNDCGSHCFKKLKWYGTIILGILGILAHFRHFYN
jgi:hypothetical protein